MTLIYFVWSRFYEFHCQIPQKINQKFLHIMLMEQVSFKANFYQKSSQFLPSANQSNADRSLYHPEFPLMTKQSYAHTLLKMRILKHATVISVSKLSSKNKVKKKIVEFPYTLFCNYFLLYIMCIFLFNHNHENVFFVPEMK